jgi:CheY-like chemotaxis protein
MPDNEVKPPTNQTLEHLLHSMLDVATEALKGAVGHELTAIPGRFATTNPDALLRKIESDHAVMMMSPQDVIEEHRKTHTLEGDELEAFAEIANIFCSGVDRLLRESLEGDVALRARDHGLIKPGEDPRDLLGKEQMIGFSFTLTIHGFPESTGLICLEPRTAERWNSQPLSLQEQDHEALSIPAPGDQILHAPLRGLLTAYVVDQESLSFLRDSCRRAGLELHRRSRNDVPDPTEHRDGIVLMDVPSGERRRFDWCKRLKLNNPDVKVVLLIHHPSRARMLEGFLAKADAIMSWPITEAELSHKLSALRNGEK